MFIYYDPTISKIREKALAAAAAAEKKAAEVLRAADAWLARHDWFAGQALAGLKTYMLPAPNSMIARQAYGLADAMIAAREESE